MTASPGRRARRQNFDRIVVICTRQIGDVLVTTPLIHAARARWPEARIDVLGFAGTLGMLDGNPDVHERVEVQAGSTWRQSLSLIRRLWRRYDLALVAQYNDRAHLYGFVAGRYRAGLVPPEPKAWWKRALLQHPIPLTGSHVLIDKLRLLEPWGGATAAEVVPPPGSALPAPYADVTRPVVVQVPSIVTYKQWPIPYFAEVAATLAREGWTVVLTGGPSAADRAAVAEVAAAASHPAVLPAAGDFDFRQLATLLKGAALYIGPDTSVTHLAAACGVPVIALFGPIDPRLWGPWAAGPSEPVIPYQSRGPLQHNGNVILLQGEQSCVPCNRAGCDRHNGSRSACLDSITPARVLAQARAILAQAPVTPLPA
jgi:heptosyltransferase-3